MQSHHDYTENFEYKLKILEAIDLLPEAYENKTIIDLGCATGAVMSYFEEYGNPEMVLGIDISSFALKRAKKRRKNLNFICASASYLPFKSGCIDTISALNTLEHFLEINEVLFEVKRVLKSNGITLILVPNELTSAYGIMSKIFKKHNHLYIINRIFSDHGHVNYFTPSSLIKTLKKFGFSLLQTYADSFIWSELPYGFFWAKISPNFKYVLKKCLKPVMKYKMVLWFTDSNIFYFKKI